MTDRTAGLTAAINKRLERNRKSRERRAEKRRQTRPVTELHREWVSSMRVKFGVDVVPKWAGADYSLAKKFVLEFGFEKAMALVRYFIETWEERRTSAQERREELPSMKLCWYLRAQLLAELEGVVSRPKSKREKVLRGEYDPASAEVSPSRGWGD